VASERKDFIFWFAHFTIWPNFSGQVLKLFIQRIML
jgi:hypothetical protein